MLRIEAATIMNGPFAVRADLTAPAGEKIAVVGPSGAGKTTLVEAVAGFLPVTAGRILWDDADITTVPPGERPVAMLFQQANLFPHLTVAQNVALGLRADMKLDREGWAQVQQALDRVGLHGMGGRKPAALSGGQQSRAALARVLVQNRPLLLLDEPFAALGPALKAEMLDLVAELVAETGVTLLMITHDPEDARRIADQIIWVEEGVAHAPTPARVLLDNPTEALQSYLGT